MFTECCIWHGKSNEWSKHSQAKFPFPSPFNAIWKTLLLLMLVFLFFTLPFLFQTLWSPNWPHSSLDFVAYELIKFVGFQISRNKSYETPYSMLQSIVVKKQKLVTIFTRTTNLELDLANFNIFWSSEYEKNWTFF